MGKRPRSEGAKAGCAPRHMRGQSGVACTGDLALAVHAASRVTSRGARARPNVRRAGVRRAHIVIVYSSIFRHAFAGARSVCLCRYHDYIVTGVARAQKYQTARARFFLHRRRGDASIEKREG